MLATALLLLPDFLLIVAGAGLVRLRWVRPESWRDIERLIYYVFFPALLFRSLALSPLTLAESGGLLTTGLAFTTVGIAASMAAMWIYPRYRHDLAGCVQCGFRFNSYLALAAGSRLHGAEGQAAIGLLIGTLVPVVNVAAVGILVSRRGRSVAAELARNPLIIATAAGAAWNAAGWPLPDVVARMTEVLGNATLALALLAVGAGMRLTGLALPAALAAHWHAVKLLLLPAVAWVVGHALGLSQAHLQLAVLMASVPTATSAYILSVQFGRDGAPVAFLISSGTLLAMLTMPAWMALSSGR